jgi:hypothetical protein
MTNQETSKSEPADRGPGTHNTGSDEPLDMPERPAGTVDEDANPPISNPDDDTGDGGVGTNPPQDAKAATPPYEGRQTSAKDIGVADDPGTGGASRPEKDAEYRSPQPQDTPAGATASPADEQPASQGSETTSSDEGVEAPAQASGTRRGEDKP